MIEPFEVSAPPPWHNLADLYHAAGRDSEAIDHLREAAAIFSEIGLGGDELQPEIWVLSDW